MAAAIIEGLNAKKSMPASSGFTLKSLNKNTFNESDCKIYFFKEEMYLG